MPSCRKLGKEWEIRQKSGALTFQTLCSLSFTHIFKPLHRPQVSVHPFFVQGRRVPGAAFQISLVFTLQFDFSSFHRFQLRCLKSPISFSVPFHGVGDQSLSFSVQVSPFVSVSLSLPKSLSVSGPRPVFISFPVPFPLPGVSPIPLPLSVVLIPISFLKSVSTVK